MRAVVAASRRVLGSPRLSRMVTVCSDGFNRLEQVTWIPCLHYRLTRAVGTAIDSRARGSGVTRRLPVARNAEIVAERLPQRVIGADFDVRRVRWEWDS